MGTWLSEKKTSGLLGSAIRSWVRSRYRTFSITPTISAALSGSEGGPTKMVRPTAAMGSTLPLLARLLAAV